MIIDPRHLEQIAAIIEHGTLREAARQLRTSQPALSRMIRHVEDRVGAKLFEPNSRPLVPTEICRTFARHGRSILAIRSKAAEDVQLDRSGMIGELRVGAPPFLCERLVGDAIASFLRERSGIRFNLTAQYFPDLERKLLTNQVDLIICPLRHLTLPKPDLSVERLFEDKHVVVARAAHPLTSEHRITVEHLERAIWISHAQASILRTDMATALSSVGIRNPKISFQTESAGSVLEMLRSTDFLTVLPSYAISDTDMDKGLCSLPIMLETPPMIVGIVTAMDQPKSKLQSAFEIHLKTCAVNKIQHT